jgi:uncharacterized membrane protein
MIFNAPVLSIGKASYANSKEVTRVPVIRVETADRAEKVRTASASSVSAERATEEITARLLPILVGQIHACTAAYAWERNPGLLILQLKLVHNYYL